MTKRKSCCPLAIIVLSLMALTGLGPGVSAAANQAKSVQITILSSNLASGGMVGEWGFSAFVEVDDYCILFDTGNFPDTVLRNAAALKVDLSCITDLVVSHHHADHTSGIPPLFEKIRGQNPDGFKRVHVAKGMFLQRRVPRRGEEQVNRMIAFNELLQDSGVDVVEYDGATEILPAVWITGPVERTHNEKNYPTYVSVQSDDAWVEDYVPESQGLTIVTDKGPIVVLGCGHSGAVNLLEQVQRDIQDHSIYALMGGMHLAGQPDETVLWTADKLKGIGLQNLMAGHCTGIEPLIQLREGLGLTRKTAVVGAVGSRFVYGEGIHPTSIAQ